MQLRIICNVKQVWESQYWVALVKQESNPVIDQTLKHLKNILLLMDEFAKIILFTGKI